MKEYSFLWIIIFIFGPLLYIFLSDYNLVNRLWIKESGLWEFPGTPVVRTLRFHWVNPGMVLGSIPGRGSKIPQAMQHGKEKKEEGLWWDKESGVGDIQSNLRN